MKKILPIVSCLLLLYACSIPRISQAEAPTGFFDALTELETPEPTPASQPRSKPAEAEGQATPLPLPTPTPVPKIVSLDDIEPEQPLLLAWGNQSNQPQGTLIVNIHGFRNDQGEVRVSLYASPEGFPDKAAKALQKKMVKIESRQAQVVFSNVPFGKYAVSVHHDEDSNAKMKSNWLGMPKEGVGASRDAKGSFGPPRFQNASFDFQDEELIISIRVNYL